MFPFSIQHCVVVAIDTSTSPQQLIKSLREELTSLKPIGLDVTGDTLHIKNGMFRLMSSYNLLRSITEGDIVVSCSGGKASIDYKLQLSEMVLMVTGLVLLLFAYPIWHAPNLDVAEKAEFLFGMWLWLAGGNFVITALRFPRFIRRCVNQVKCNDQLSGREDT